MKSQSRELMHMLRGRKQRYERELVVNVITESGSIDDGQGDTNAVFFELYGSQNNNEGQ